MTTNENPAKDSFWQRVKDTLFPENYIQAKKPDEPYIISRVLHFRSRYIPLSHLKK
ncbi:hypothetical protein [Dyadobacter aurulentus]|uniref:hypothetical protein n=1 Tax=Dyadobacter sp. UC 10 TaxID=2605428 RepID=UPI001788BE27|nr:hypothetical protein [Dyadobacter sp. UC 10]